MADKKKQPAKTSKSSGSTHSGAKKKKELSMDDLGKVSGGASKKARGTRQP